MSSEAPPQQSRIAVESNGVNPVPDDERRGDARSLFAVWFSWNVSVMGTSYGIYVMGLGLSAGQAMLAGIAGYVLSSALVGVLAVGGPRTGLPTLTQTRFCFGIDGNRVPAFFAWLSNMGWKVTIITLASTTGAGIAARLWPARFATADGRPVTWLTGVWFVGVVALTLVGAFYGHAVIMRLEQWIAWLTGAMTLVFIGIVAGHVHLSSLHGGAHGSPLAFVGGVVMAMTMVGLGFLNYGGDFSRYLPRRTPARAVVGWTTLGIALPVSVLLVLGVLLAASNPELGRRAAADPIAAPTVLLPTWFFVSFSLVIVVSLVSAAMTGIYSSGLALLAMGVRLPRARATLLNCVVIAAGALYLLFVSDSFLATFQAFLAVISVVMGTMGGIELVDFLRQRRLGWDVRMALPPAQGGRRVRWTAVGSLVVASVLGLGLVTSSDPWIARVVGFLLTDAQRQGVVGSSNIGVVVAMVVGSALYALLTLVLRLDMDPPAGLLPQGEPAGRRA